MPVTLPRYAPEVLAKVREIVGVLKGARRVLITSEPYPDGDAFGTELALEHVCRHAFAIDALSCQNNPALPAAIKPFPPWRTARLRACAFAFLIGRPVTLLQ